GARIYAMRLAHLGGDRSMTDLAKPPHAPGGQPDTGSVTSHFKKLLFVIPIMETLLAARKRRGHGRCAIGSQNDALWADVACGYSHGPPLKWGGSIADPAPISN